MTSSNGNIFRVTGHLCGEFTGPRWIPRWIPAQRPVTRSFDIFFDQRLNKRLRKQSWGWWFETLSLPLWRHCNGIIMCARIVGFNGIKYLYFVSPLPTRIIRYRFSTQMCHYIAKNIFNYLYLDEKWRLTFHLWMFHMRQINGCHFADIFNTDFNVSLPKIREMCS